MKGTIILAALLTIAGFVGAQTEVEKPANQPKIKEVPADASHGKAISELARNTPGGPEKGKIISSAARQKGIEQREGRNPKDNAPVEAKNNRPGNNSKGKGALSNGKPASTPRAVPPAKPKPGGFHGGS